MPSCAGKLYDSVMGVYDGVMGGVYGGRVLRTAAVAATCAAWPRQEAIPGRRPWWQVTNYRCILPAPCHVRTDVTTRRSRAKRFCHKSDRDPEAKYMIKFLDDGAGCPGGVQAPGDRCVLPLCEVNDRGHCTSRVQAASGSECTPNSSVQRIADRPVDGLVHQCWHGGLHTEG